MKKYKILAYLILLSTLVNAQIYKQHDKQAHFFAGALISQTVYYSIKDKKKAIIYAIAAPILIGTLKECCDLANPKKKRFDGNDLLATSLGITILIPIKLFDK